MRHLLTKREAIYAAERLHLVQPTDSVVDILRRQTADVAGKSLAELMEDFEREIPLVRESVASGDPDAMFAALGPFATTTLALLGRSLADACVLSAERTVGFAQSSES